MPVFIKNENMRCVTPLDNTFICDHMPKAPGEYVKVYIYGLMRALSPGEDNESCPFTDEQLAAAYTYWQGEGLVRVVQTDPLSVEYREVGAQYSGSARKYASLVAKLTEVAGTRVFSGHELSEIYDWIETFRFEQDAAVLLVSDSIARHGARVRQWQMNAEAKLWADNGIMTVEDARAFIARRDERNRGAQAVLARWKRPRAATEDELALYAKWREDWGFTDEAILGACAELTGAEKPSFKYLDAVLDTYRIKGAITAEAANAVRAQRDATGELARLMLARAGVERAPTAAQKDDVDLWRNRWHMDAELLLLASDASKNAAQPYAAIKKLVTAWHETNISDLAAARADIEKHSRENERRDAAKKARAYGSGQRKYTEEELKKIGVDILDD